LAAGAKVFFISLLQCHCAIAFYSVRFISLWWSRQTDLISIPPYWLVYGKMEQNIICTRNPAVARMVEHTDWQFVRHYQD